MGWMAPVAPEVARAAHDAVVDKYCIHCPFKEKNEAKALGARWSATHKTWYAPDDDVYAQLAKWHKPDDKPQKTIAKKSKFPGGKTAEKAWDTYMAGDSEEATPKKKKFKKYPKALIHQEPELYPEPPPAPRKAPPVLELKVWAESVPIFGLD